MKNRKKRMLIGSQVLLIVVLALISWYAYTMKMEAELNAKNLKEYLEEGQDFETKINKQGEELALQKEVIISKNRKIEKELLKNSDLKRLNRQIKIKTETRIDSILAKYDSDDYVIYRTDTINDTIRINVPFGIKIGTPFTLKNDWYYSGGKITQGGVLFDSLSFKNDLTVSVGRMRKGWFKPMETMVEVRNENPYTRVINLNNIKVENRSKLIDKPWFTFLIGTTAGLVVGILAK